MLSQLVVNALMNYFKIKTIHILFFPAQQQSQHGHKRPRSPSPQRSGIPPAYYRNQLHPGPSTTKASYSVPTSAHASHYTSYPGSAVVSVGM